MQSFYKYNWWCCFVSMLFFLQRSNIATLFCTLDGACSGRPPTLHTEDQESVYYVWSHGSASLQFIFPSHFFLSFYSFFPRLSPSCLDQGNLTDWCIWFGVHGTVPQVQGLYTVGVITLMDWACVIASLDCACMIMPWYYKGEGIWRHSSIRSPVQYSFRALQR